jgi:hypothetical protein
MWSNVPEPDSGEGDCNLALVLTPANAPTPPGHEAPDAQVLKDSQVSCETELLMDKGEAEDTGTRWVQRQRHLLFPDHEFGAWFGRMKTRQALDEG